MSLTKQNKVRKVFMPRSNMKKQKETVEEATKKISEGSEKPKEERKYGKIVVYTCVTGAYDNFITPKKEEGIDYICFTDNTGATSSGWELRPIPDELTGLTKVKQQRMIKVLPHKYLLDYDISIWVDGSVEVKGDVKEFLNSIIYTGYSVFVPTHPQRKCIYKECQAVKALKKDTTDLPDKQMEKYKKEGYPEDYGLVQSNIMVRWHNNEDCIKLMECWAEEIRNLSHRDQLSFNYAVWKTKSTCFKAIDKKTCNSKYFYWNPMHGSHVNKKLSTVKKK